MTVLKVTLFFLSRHLLSLCSGLLRLTAGSLAGLAHCHNEDDSFLLCCGHFAMVPGEPGTDVLDVWGRCSFACFTSLTLFYLETEVMVVGVGVGLERLWAWTLTHTPIVCQALCWALYRYCSLFPTRAQRSFTLHVLAISLLKHLPSVFHSSQKDLWKTQIRSYHLLKRLPSLLATLRVKSGLVLSVYLFSSSPATLPPAHRTPATQVCLCSSSFHRLAFTFAGSCAWHVLPLCFQGHLFLIVLSADIGFLDSPFLITLSAIVSYHLTMLFSW